MIAANEVNDINRFHATGLFLYPLKTSENQRFSDVFRCYRKRPVAWNGLMGWHEKHGGIYDGRLRLSGSGKKTPFPGHSQRKIHPDVIFSETAGVMVWILLTKEQFCENNYKNFMAKVTLINFT